MAYFSKEQIKEASSTNLVHYAQRQGYKLSKPSGGFYKVEDRNLGGLYITEKGFQHFSEDKKGNTIQFLMEYENRTFPEAVEQLLGTRAYPTHFVPLPTPTVKEDRGEMVLPTKSQSTTKVTSYLVGERCLDREIVADLIKQGAIFQAVTQRGTMTFSNCAFVGYDKESTPKYCSLRSMGASNFRQDLTNSDKSYPFVMKGRSERLFIFESPIDCVSHASLTKLNGMDYAEDSRISTGGLMEKGIERFLAENPQIKTVVFAFDNDKDGKDSRGNPHNYGQVFSVKCAKKYRDQGYTTQIQVPQNKDFNADLQQIIRAVREQTPNKKPPVKTAPPPKKTVATR